MPIWGQSLINITGLHLYHVFCTLSLRGSQSWPHAPDAFGALSPPTETSPVVALVTDWIIRPYNNILPSDMYFSVHVCACHCVFAYLHAQHVYM